MRAQELAPSRTPSSWSRTQLMAPEQAADGPGRDLEAELEELTADAQVAPARVIAGYAEATGQMREL